MPGIAGVDTRALTVRIRDGGAAERRDLPFPPTARFDLAALRAQAAGWPGLEGMDLAKEVSCRQSYSWDETRWAWPAGLRPADGAEAQGRGGRLRREAQHPALPGRCRLRGDGGAGDRDGRGHPAPRAGRRVPVQRPRRPGGDRRLRRAGDPGRAGRRASRSSASAWATSCWRWRWAAKTYKLDRGHRGANQPVKDLATGKVEITSQNHGFAVDAEDPARRRAACTHVSLFDGIERGHRLQAKRGVQRAVPPGGEPGAERQPLPVPPLRRADGRRLRRGDLDALRDLAALLAQPRSGRGRIGVGGREGPTRWAEPRSSTYDGRSTLRTPPSRREASRDRPLREAAAPATRSHLLQSRPCSSHRRRTTPTARRRRAPRATT